MARTQTIVQLSDELVEALDAEARRRRISRSAVVRDAVVAHLAEQRQADVTAQIVEGYRRQPQAVPDEWGGPEEPGERGTVEALQRLDAEEWAAGLDPW